MDINAAFDAGALTSERLVEMYLRRIEAYDGQGPRLNSILTLNPDALEVARRLDEERRRSGPRSLLHGIPIVLKDNINTVDLQTAAASVTLAGSIPSEDAFVVKRLRDAGAIVLAKVNMSEFATPAGRGAYSSLKGITLNPYDLRRDPAGSSGGTATAVAANFATFGLGTDTGGSIRGPAAATGLVGIRPTYGLISRHGIIPQALSLDTTGPMARNVTDAAIALSAMTGVDENDPTTRDSTGRYHEDYTPFLDPSALSGARIGVVRTLFGGNPEVDSLVNAAIDEMGRLGAVVVESIVLGDELTEAMSGLRARINAEFQPYLEVYLATLEDGYPRTLAEIIAASESPEVVASPTPVNPGLISTHRRNLEIGGLDGPEYRDAIENGLPRVKAAMQRLLDDHDLDAFVYPTSRCPARTIYTIEDPDFVCSSGPSGANLASFSGFPDLQLPVGFTAAGLPVTISFVGRPYSEPELLGYAFSLEQATRHWRLSPFVPSFPGETLSY